MAQITVEAGTINQFFIDEVDYLRQDIVVKYNEEYGTVNVANPTETLIEGVVFSDIIPDGGIDAFQSFEEMKSWFDNNVKFNSYVVTALPSSDCWLINRKPYKKGSLFFLWHDDTEELEVRHSHYDYQDKPITKTSYGNIVREDEVEGFESYAALIQWLITNTFTDTTPA